MTGSGIAALFSVIGVPLVVTANLDPLPDSKLVVAYQQEIHPGPGKSS
jgi:hypothetical protein